MDSINTLINRHQGNAPSKSGALANHSQVTNITPQQLLNSSSNSATTMINTNGLPSSIINDQYGLVGLLQLIQQAEKNPDTATLLNCDLTTLGLSMLFLL
jgi:hypothetical protein